MSDKFSRMRMFSSVCLGISVWIGVKSLTVPLARATQPVDDSMRASDASKPTETTRQIIDLPGVPWSRLLGFDSPREDATFLHASRFAFDRDSAFTGAFGLRVPVAERLRIKLGALVLGREFPGRWSMLGLHVRVDRAASMILVLRADERPIATVSIDLEPGWQRAWLSIPSLVPATDGLTLEVEVSVEMSGDRSGERSGEPRDRIEGDSSATVMLDDLIVAAPTRVVVAPSDDGLSVVRRDTRWEAITGDGEPLRLPWDPLDGGYRLIEASPLRVRFESPSGERVSMDRHGRRYPLDDVPPVDVDPIDETARLIRHRPGDSDADAFDESCGSFVIRARQSRVRLRIDPGEGAIDRPMFEVENLPSGNVRVTADGSWIDPVIRLPDGRVLVELPMRVDRAMTLEIGVVDEIDGKNTGRRVPANQGESSSRR
jgi:hypothetical protein